MELLVVNAKHIKVVPGRKTDGKDAEWIAHLLLLKNWPGRTLSMPELEITEQPREPVLATH